MARVTRLQLDVLDKKLSKIVNDKIKEYSKSKPNNLDSDFMIELIQSGKVKIKKKITKSHWTLEVSDVFDFSKYEEECRKNNTLINNFRAKLDAKKQAILDTYVLQGLDDIKEMIKELEEFEVK